MHSPNLHSQCLMAASDKVPLQNHRHHTCKVTARVTTCNEKSKQAHRRTIPVIAIQTYATNPHASARSKILYLALGKIFREPCKWKQRIKCRRPSLNISFLIGT